MKPVGFEYILPQPNPVEDGKYRIHPIDQHKSDPEEAVRFNHQHQHQGNHPEGNADTAHVAGKAACLFSEIEKQEHGRCHHGVPDQIGIYKGDLHQVDVLHARHGGQTVQAGNAVDAVHEVPGIDDAHKYDVPHRDGPPGELAKNSGHLKNQCHGRQMEKQAYQWGSAFDVVIETDQGDQGNPGKEEPAGFPGVEQPEQNGRHPVNDASAPEGYRGMGAALVGFVNDIIPVGDSEIYKYA